MVVFEVYVRKSNDKGSYQRYFKTTIEEQARVGCKNLTKLGYECYYVMQGNLFKNLWKSGIFRAKEV